MGSDMHISRRMALLIVIAVSVAAYASTLGNGFVWDDSTQILENSWMRGAGSLTAIFSSNVWGYLDDTMWLKYYRPLVNVVYIFVYRAFGMEAWGFHLTSLFLNVLVSVVVFLFFSAVYGRRGSDDDLRSNSELSALAATFIFVLHPVHVEAVAFASAIGELLFVLFGLLSLHLHARSNALGGYAASAACFLLSLFSKETALAFLPLIIAYDYCLRGRVFPARYAFHAVALVVYFAARWNALHGVIPISIHAPGMTPFESVLGAFFFFGAYVWKLVWPADLNVYYVFHGFTRLYEWKAVVSIFFAVGYASLFYFAPGIVRFALLWIALPLLPVIYAWIIGAVIFSDRYLYLSTAGFALLAVVAAQAVWQRRIFGKFTARILLAIFILIASLYAGSVSIRNDVWRDNLELWRDSIIKNPDGDTPNNEFGAALYRAGFRGEAEKYYRKALEINPSHLLAHYNLGIAYKDSGRFDDAVREYKEAIRIYPYFYKAYNNLGAVYVEKGMIKEAVEEFKTSIEINKNYAMAHYNLGKVYEMQGLKKEAEKELEEARRLELK